MYCLIFFLKKVNYKNIVQIKYSIFIFPKRINSFIC